MRQAPGFELFEAACGGDREAFLRLTSEHWDGLFAEAYGILGGLEPAEDAFVAGVLAAWRDLRGIQGPEGLEGLLRDRVTRVSLAEAGRHPGPVASPRDPASPTAAFEIDVAPHLPERAVDELTERLRHTGQLPAWRLRWNPFGRRAGR